MTTPADWYPDPSDSSLLRYWDGSAWTEHTAPAPVAQPAPAAPAPPAEPEVVPGAPAPPVATPSPLPSGLARSSLFAESNREQPTTGRMTRQNPAVAKVTLGQPLLVARGAMIAYQGEVAFSYQGAGMKRMLKAMGTSEGMQLMRCDGAGELFVSRGNRKLHLIELGPGEQMSASSRALLGFDATVQWDITAIKGGMGSALAGGLFNIQITGPGEVILASDWPVVLNTSEARTCVDPNALVAWTAGLTTTVRSTFTAGSLIGRGSGEAFQLEFSPGGYVIVEPEAVIGA
ncbi:MAG TPA: AIM24 family protein [Acidimicrobiales bacterium]